MDIQEAQDTPRFMPDPFSDVVEVEEPISDELRDGLRALDTIFNPLQNLLVAHRLFLLIGKQGC